MNDFKFKDKARALVIVAHPDDETIWLGGTVMKHPLWDWTILSLCRASDKDRAPKFFRVCKFYKARGIITDLEDEGRLSIAASVSLIEKLIQSKIKNEKFDYVFAHGQNGEYGHPRHKGVNIAVNNLIKRGKIKTDFVFWFNYKKTSQRQFSPLQTAAKTDILIKLNKREFRAKQAVVIDIYGFAKNGIDVGYCTNPEALRFKKFNHD